MPEKFLKVAPDGSTTEQEALAASAGAGDAGKVPALGGDGRFDQSMMPAGVGPAAKSIVASEALAAGNMVNVWNDAGTPKARKADASSPGKRCVGFVLAAFGAGQQALVFTESIVTGLSGLTPGVRYFLSNTVPGGITSDPVTQSGHILQFIGTAISDTELAFEPADPILRA